MKQRPWDTELLTQGQEVNGFWTNRRRIMFSSWQCLGRFATDFSKSLDFSAQASLAVACMHTHTNAHTNKCMHSHTYPNVHTRVHTYTQVHTDTHTHTHLNVLLPSLARDSEKKRPYQEAVAAPGVF